MIKDIWQHWWDGGDVIYGNDGATLMRNDGGDQGLPPNDGSTIKKTRVCRPSHLCFCLPMMARAFVVSSNHNIPFPWISSRHHKIIIEKKYSHPCSYSSYHNNSNLYSVGCKRNFMVLSSLPGQKAKDVEGTCGVVKACSESHGCGLRVAKAWMLCVVGRHCTWKGCEGHEGW